MRRTIAALSLLLASGLAANAQPAAEDCTDIAYRWAATFTAEPDLEVMVNLFQPNAIVWGTSSRTLVTDPAGIRTYFTAQFSRAVRTQSQILSSNAIQVADNVWVTAGVWEATAFTQDEARTPTVTQGRFHFVVVREGNECKIAAFNSSRMPDPPATPAPATPAPAAPR